MYKKYFSPLNILLPIFFLFFSITSFAVAQDTLFSNSIDSKLDTSNYISLLDTNQKSKVISPKHAALWAIALGGGQIYNKKYWKLPIVYGLLGGGAYFIARNGRNLKIYNNALNLKLRGIDNPDDKFNQLTIDQVTSYRNLYRKNLEMSTVVTTLLWGLSFVDAVVDAHLHAFDISDDLAMKVSPKILTVDNNYYATLQLTLHFKN